MSIGDRIKLTQDIYEEGEDVPPGYLAMRGEVLIVRDVRNASLCVSHEHITDSSFHVFPGEWVSAGGE